MKRYYVYKMTKAGAGKPKVMTYVSVVMAGSRKSAAKLIITAKKATSRDNLMIFTRSELLRADTRA